MASREREDWQASLANAVCCPNTAWVSWNSVLNRAEPGTPLTDQEMLELHLLHNKHLDKALPLVTGHQVRCLRAQESGRKIFKVQGSKPGDEYVVLLNEYCSCQAFQQMIFRGETGCCKHQLAVQICERLQCCVTTEVPDTALAQDLLAVALGAVDMADDDGELFDR